MGAPRAYGQVRRLDIGGERQRRTDAQRRCLRLLRDGRRCQRLKQRAAADWCGPCRHELARSAWRRGSAPRRLVSIHPTVTRLWEAAIQKSRPVIRPEIREKVRALWARSVAGAAPGKATE